MDELSIETVVADTRASLRDHFSAFSTLGAAFVFLPLMAMAVAFGSLSAVMQRWALAVQAAQRLGSTALPAIPLPAGYLPAYLLMMLLAAVGQFTINAIAGDANRPVTETVGTTVLRAIPGVLRYVGFVLLSVIAAFIVLFIAGLVLGVIGAVVLGGSGNPAVFAGVGVILALLMFVPAVWLFTRLSLLPAVYVVERARLFQGPARAWRLTRGRFWVLLATFTLWFATLLVISLVAGAVLGGLGLRQAIAAGGAQGLLLDGLNSVLGTVFSVVFAIIIGVIYRRLAASPVAVSRVFE